MMRAQFGFAAILLAVASSSCLAQDNDTGAGSGTFSLVFENDRFNNADRHYTSGVRASWLTRPGTTPTWALTAARVFPLFPIDGSIRSNYAIGQNMYTPTDITLTDPPRGSRPYAGWLYGSLGLIAENGRRLDQLQLSVGMVGPAAMAKQTQKAIHRLTGADDPRGWDHQLKNEPGFMLTYQRSERGFATSAAGGFGIDLTPHAGITLGNVMTYANAGATLRVGRNLPLDYGPPKIQPSLPGSGFFVPQNGFGWYIFAGIEGRAVARNIFLDGNSFRNGPSVDRRPFVGDLQYGIAVTWHDIRLSYTHAVRTREFDGQGPSDGFGSFSLSLPL